MREKRAEVLLTVDLYRAAIPGVLRMEVDRLLRQVPEAYVIRIIVEAFDDG